jgi:hypothetical protein
VVNLDFGNRSRSVVPSGSAQQLWTLLLHSHFSVACLVVFTVAPKLVSTAQL